MSRFIEKNLEKDGVALTGHLGGILSGVEVPN